MTLIYENTGGQAIIYSISDLAYQSCWCICTHTTNNVKFSIQFWVVSMNSVHLGDVTKGCCSPSSHHTVHTGICTGSLFRNQEPMQMPSGAALWNTINSSTHVHYLTAIHATWEQKHAQVGLEHGQQCCHRQVSQ